MEMSWEDWDWFPFDRYEPSDTSLDTKGVVKAKRIEDGKLFAIKRSPKESKGVYQFLKNYNFKGIPKTEEIINRESYIIIVEEYIDAPNLRTLLDRGVKFNEKEAKWIITSLSNILKPLHNHLPAIIHRDIKPENVLLDSNDKVWLIDWGAAKKEHTYKNRDTVLMGTEGYAAPEQYGFSQSDPSTDIYALGVLLNEILTGHLPSEKKCTGRMRTVVDKCTELEKANRYKSVEELKKAINLSDWRRWLPPGFRGRSIVLKLVSSFLYLFLAYGTLAMDVKDSASITETILNRIFSFILFFSIVLFSGNWGNIWPHLFLLKEKNKVLKTIGFLLWLLLLIIMVMSIFYLFEWILL
ncbi:MAG: serine/threonine protein kinase [Candidatus Ornithospirochaeta sp.]